MLDRLPRLTADHSAGAPISRDDQAWLIMQVWQLRAQLADAEASLVELADDCGDQCNHTTTLVDGPSRCVYDKGHTSSHSFKVMRYIPAVLGAASAAKDIRPATSPPRWCRARTEEHLHCAYRYGHSGPCSYAEDGDHEDTYQ